MTKNSNKPARWLMCAMCAIFMLAACSGGNHAKARYVVDALNAPEFRARELETGLFTGSNAEMVGDTIVFTVDCTDKVNIKNLPPFSRAFLEQSATLEFAKLCGNEEFRQGMEALRDEKMGLKIVWRAQDGASVAVRLSPSAILAADN